MSDRRQEQGGVLFPIMPDKRRDNGPTMDGRLAIEGDVATYIFEKLSNNETPEIKLAAWSRMGKSNNKFLSIKTEIPWADHPDNMKRGTGGGRQQGTPPSYNKGGGGSGRMDDDIPF